MVAAFCSCLTLAVRPCWATLTAATTTKTPRGEFLSAGRRPLARAIASPRRRARSVSPSRSRSRSTAPQNALPADAGGSDDGEEDGDDFDDEQLRGGRRERREIELISYRPTRLRALFELPRSLVVDAELYFQRKPRRLLTAGALALLIGFFSASSALTIIGSVADWDPLAAAVLLFWTEIYTRVYYSSQQSKRNIAMQLLNAFKIGVTYGLTVDAMKLSS